MGKFSHQNALNSNFNWLFSVRKYKLEKIAHSILNNQIQGSSCCWLKCKILLILNQVKIYAHAKLCSFCANIYSWQQTHQRPIDDNFMMKEDFLTHGVEYFTSLSSQTEKRRMSSAYGIHKSSELTCSNNCLGKMKTSSTDKDQWLKILLTWSIWRRKNL